jgi:hypothetical protein
LLRSRGVKISHHCDFDRTPRPTAYFFGITRKHGESTGTHGADTQQTNFDRFHDE